MKSLLWSTIHNNLIDKVGGDLVILSTEHCHPTLAAEFLHLLEKLCTLCDTLLDSKKDLKISLSKSEEKSMLKTKMREDL